MLAWLFFRALSNVKSGAIPDKRKSLNYLEFTMSIQFLPVVVPAELVGETYLLFHNFAVTAVPAGIPRDQGLKVGEVDENGQYWPNTKHVFSSALLRKASKMFEKAFNQLSSDQLIALGLIKADIPGVLESIRKHQQNFKQEQEKRRAEAEKRRADGPVLTPEQVQARDNQRAEAAQRRAEASKAEAEALRQVILGLTPEQQQDEVLLLLASLKNVSSPKTVVNKLSEQQILMICDAKNIDTTGSPLQRAERILALKAQQNGSFATT